MMDLSGLIKIFTDPVAAFQGMTRNSSWIVPFMIIVLIGGVVGFYVAPIRAEYERDGQIRIMDKYKDQMPAENYDQAMKDLDDRYADQMAGKFVWYYPLIVVGGGFLYFIIFSLIAWVLGNFVYGGKAGFWQVMNVVILAGIITLGGDLIRNSLILYKGSMEVYTGLGLVSHIFGEKSFLHYMLRQVDFFTLWRVIATGIGLGVIYKMKSGKFNFVLIGIWFVIMIIFALLNTYITEGMIIY